MRSLLAILLYCLSLLPAHAENLSLELPRWFELLYLNGATPSSSLLGDRDYPLQQGINLLVVRYGDNIKIRRDDSEVITSAPQAIWLDAGVPGHYRLVAEQPANLAQARAFANAPQLQIVLAGQPQAFTQRPLTGLGLMPNQRELELAIADLGAARPGQPAPIKASLPTGSETTGAVDPGLALLGQLQQLYLSSSPDIRKQFRHWLIEQQ